MVSVYRDSKNKSRDTCSWLSIIKNNRTPKPNITWYKDDAPLKLSEQFSLVDKNQKLIVKYLLEEKQLGSGHFGVAMKAKAYGVWTDKPVLTVAVKSAHNEAESIYLRALERGLKIMIHLGRHLNIVNLLGACTKNIAQRELLIILEFCKFGNLQELLLQNRRNLINQPNSLTGTINSPVKQELQSRIAHDLNNRDTQPGWRSNYQNVCNEATCILVDSENLLYWAFQYLIIVLILLDTWILHADLAARNILLSENNIVKICDFGLAKMIYKDGYYKKQRNGAVPVAWMATESIRNGIFLTMSDVWSFGVVLWEFFTFADILFLGMDIIEQLERLINGYRLEQPKYATSTIYDIMLCCWKAEPTLRPSFTELIERIGELLKDDVKLRYMNLNHTYQVLNQARNFESQYDYLAMASSSDHPTLGLTQHEYVNCIITTQTIISFCHVSIKATSEELSFSDVLVQMILRDWTYKFGNSITSNTYLSTFYCKRGIILRIAKLKHNTDNEIELVRSAFLRDEKQICKEEAVLNASIVGAFVLVKKAEKQLKECKVLDEKFLLTLCLNVMIMS
ncbi:vascular endothelial growth factor receptor kdr-like [Copidosoma floridanum]|uniref:vascular endothelial growth factor receptor kdr-like n=1 Tax=Copidosoma floridanum TaxID=29053 RepID=UPI0006C9C821|nr:vascular endothelial growth factor receptor kdr-like [Copidosoma floridanum]